MSKNGVQTWFSTRFAARFSTSSCGFATCFRHALDTLSNLFCRKPGREPAASISAVAIYRSTLSTLLDRHAPFCRRSISTRRSEPWFDRVCRAAKRLTRKLKRAYRRRRHSTTARTAWQLQFHEQRRVFRRKVEDYWRSTIAQCRYDSRQLWSKLDGATENAGVENAARA